MRKVSWFVGAVTLLASAAYVFIYLYRWEWHRALFVAVVFVAVEVAMATGLVLRQLAASPQGPPPTARAVPDPRVLARLRDAPGGQDRFQWLARDLGRTHVFVTALLGGGVLLSAGAWAVDRIAHRTAGPALDRGLAIRLGALAFPPDGLVADDAELLASDVPYHDEPDLRLLLGPQGRRR